MYELKLILNNDDHLVSCYKNECIITFNYHKVLEEPIVLGPSYSKYKVKMLDHQVIKDLEIEYWCTMFLNSSSSVNNVTTKDIIKALEFGDSFVTKKYNIPSTTINFINIEIELWYDSDRSNDYIDNSLLDDMTFEFEIKGKKLNIPKIVITSPDETCCICYNQTYSFTKCIHYVCKDCFKEWTTSQSSCPMCRQKLSLKNYVE
jgi:hypothetical protein